MDNKRPAGSTPVIVIVVRERQKRPIDAGKPKGTGVDYYFLNRAESRRQPLKENRFYPEDLIRDIHACTPVYLERLLGRHALFVPGDGSVSMEALYKAANFMNLCGVHYENISPKDFWGDGVEIVSHAGWIAAEQDMRRHSNQSRYNCKLKHAMEFARITGMTDDDNASFNHVRAKKRHIQNLHADRIEQLNKYLT